MRRAPGGGLAFEVDGLCWLSRFHVVNAQNRGPAHLDRFGFQPVEDAGIAGLASAHKPSDDDCTTGPDEVAEPVAAEAHRLTACPAVSPEASDGQPRAARGAHRSRR